MAFSRTGRSSQAAVVQSRQHRPVVARFAGGYLDSLLPLFPLEIVLFPGAPLPLHIFEPRYKEMIGECLAQDRPFGMVRAKESALSAIGCSASIVTIIKKYDDGRLDIAAEGEQRFEIRTLNQ